MFNAKTAVARPPAFNVHQHNAEVDTVEELNEWAISLFSPLYSDSAPAFSVDANGELHAAMGASFTPVPDGFWLLFNEVGAISVLSPDDFAARYELTTP